MPRILLAAAACGLLCPWAAAQDAARLDAMLADVRRMEVDSNDGRGDALMRILEERGVPYAVESFEIEPRADYPRTVGRNIVVTLGADADAGDIVVGAHYDAVWLGDGALSRGAVDNAASSVILVWLAETLSTDPLEHRVRIVFFDMEEIGLVGSREFVRRHADAPIAAAVNLDVNGYGDTVFFGPTASGGNGGVHAAMRQACAEVELECVAFPRYPASDYLSFQRAGVPNVSVSVLPSNEAEEMYAAYNDVAGEGGPRGGVPALFRLIHTARDTSESVDPAAMDTVYRTVLALLRQLDAGLESAP